MQEMTSVGVLETDSSNILELIKDGFVKFNVSSIFNLLMTIST